MKGAVKPPFQEKKIKIKVKLQGIYETKETKKVKDLKVGDIIKWNYGYTSTVFETIFRKIAKTFSCMLKSNQDGIIRERKMGAERLVAII